MSDDDDNNDISSMDDVHHQANDINDDINSENDYNEEKSSMRRDAELYSKNLAKRGVIYLSRIPPFLKPNKARTLLEEYGEITRLYLAEEDESARKRRKLAGGNGSKQFVEGWVEFADKKIAKKVAESLNNTAMDGRKRGFYHDDMWSMKYLKNFKWDLLTEKFAYERRVRENKLKAAMLQAKRQNADYVELVERNKVFERVQKRKSDRGEGGSIDEEVSRDKNQDDLPSSRSVKRRFKQVQSIATKPGESYDQIEKSIAKQIFPSKFTVRNKTVV